VLLPLSLAPANDFRKGCPSHGVAAAAWPAMIAPLSKFPENLHEHKSA
jgi:hypothetical protein